MTITESTGTVAASAPRVACQIATCLRPRGVGGNCRRLGPLLHATRPRRCATRGASGVERAVLTALAKLPADRLVNAAEFVRAMQAQAAPRRAPVSVGVRVPALADAR